MAKDAAPGKASLFLHSSCCHSSPHLVTSCERLEMKRWWAEAAAGLADGTQ